MLRRLVQQRPRARHSSIGLFGTYGVPALAGEMFANVRLLKYSYAPQEAVSHRLKPGLHTYRPASSHFLP
jgi:hypothetical protein